MNFKITKLQPKYCGRYIFCFLKISYSMTALAHDTFIDEIEFFCGIVIITSHFSFIFWWRPNPSLPTTKTAGKGISVSCMLLFPFSAPIIQNPFSLSSSIACEEFVTLAILICSIAPAEVLETVSLTVAERHFGTITPSTPKATVTFPPNMCQSKVSKINLLGC